MAGSDQLGSGGILRGTSRHSDKKEKQAHS
jgi:hypothetical protein